MSGRDRPRAWDRSDPAGPPIDDGSGDRPGRRTGRAARAERSRDREAERGGPRDRERGGDGGPRYLPSYLQTTAGQAPAPAPTPAPPAAPAAPAAAAPAPTPAPTGRRGRGPLPQRAPGQALDRSTLSKGVRSTGDPRYETGSTPALPPETFGAPPGAPEPGRGPAPDARGAGWRDRRADAAPQAYAEPPAPGWDDRGAGPGVAGQGWNGPTPGAPAGGQDWGHTAPAPSAGDRAPGPAPQRRGAGPAGFREPGGWDRGATPGAPGIPDHGDTGGWGRSAPDDTGAWSRSGAPVVGPDDTGNWSRTGPGGFGGPDGWDHGATPGGFGGPDGWDHGATPGAPGAPDHVDRPGDPSRWERSGAPDGFGPQAHAGPPSGQFRAVSPGAYAPTPDYAPDHLPADPFDPATGWGDGDGGSGFDPAGLAAAPAAPLAAPPAGPDLGAPPRRGRRGGPDANTDDPFGDPGDGDGPHDDRPARRRERGPAELDDAPRLPYVPGFDGLRAVALVAVLAFHQGYDLARGGFLGLSSFFTLAGFLLGTLGLAEWSQAGYLSLSRLWERRARRIVPAYVVALALVVVLQFVLRVGVGPGFRGDVGWALGFAENWRAVVTGRDIASVFVSTSPVQHLWSVGLLVQLLVLVPLGFAGLMKLTGKRWRIAGASVGAVAALSFAAAKLTADVNGNGGLAYFGTHTRAGELLVGVALAYLVLGGSMRRLLESDAGRSAVRFGGPAALVALVALWSLTSLDDPRLFGGITLLNAVLTAWVILSVTTSGPATTVLGAWPLRTLGRFAFTAYLVHWPIYLLVDEPRIELNESLQFAARVGLTLVVAAGLHYAVERPWHEGLRMPRPRVAAILAAAMAAVLVACVVLPQQPPVGVSLSIGDGSGPGQLDVVVPGSGGGRSVALVGDALAGSLVTGVEYWNERSDQQVRLATHITDGCPPGAPGPVRLAGRTIGEGAACRGWEPRLPHLLDAAQPDVVVVVTGLDELGERDLDGAWRHLGDPAYDDWLALELEELADTLADAGVPVMWATIPHVRLPGADGDWTRHDENDPRRVDRYNQLLRDAAEGHGEIEVVDLTAWAQDLPRGGEFGPDYRQDGAVFTERGANGAMSWLLEQALDAAGAPAGETGTTTTTVPSDG